MWYKKAHNKADQARARVFLNIAPITEIKDGPKVSTKCHWRIMVDEKMQ